MLPEIIRMNIITSIVTELTISSYDDLLTDSDTTLNSAHFICQIKDSLAKGFNLIFYIRKRGPFMLSNCRFLRCFFHMAFLQYQQTDPADHLIAVGIECKKPFIEQNSEKFSGCELSACLQINLGRGIMLISESH